MNTRAESSPSAFLSKKSLLALILIAATAFHLAFADSRFSILILIYLGCLVELTRASSARSAFYAGFALGLLVFAPKLTFFYTIFGIAAAPLWFILALWHALYAFVGQRARSELISKFALFILPIAWTGLEYFRSELYPLKFSWLSPAFAFGPSPLIHIFGAFGATFLLLCMVAGASSVSKKSRIVASLLTVAIAFALTRPSQPIPTASEPALKLAGIQLEFPVELEVPNHLDLLKQKHPDADIYILSEYTFDGPIPKRIRAWCKNNSKYLIAGAKDPAPNGDFYNTAFVIGPNGEDLFKQVKAVPIQFFKDGLPAPSQRVWDSPWGKIGICICYDLSYTRVTDELVRQGAQIIINPTMDVADWGRAQHELHSRIAPMRAAEYGIPIFRLASSGISHAVSAAGQVLARAPFPGEKEILSATFPLTTNARHPLDRYFAPLCSAFAALAILLTLLSERLRSILSWNDSVEPPQTLTPAAPPSDGRGRKTGSQIATER